MSDPNLFLLVFLVLVTLGSLVLDAFLALCTIAAHPTIIQASILVTVCAAATGALFVATL